jgi:outer membrane immunogenic protein
MAYFSTAAFSADITTDPAYDWTGFYFGVQAGYGFGKDHIHDEEVGTGISDYSDKFKIDGIIGGAHAGYNKQINSIVLGLEGDLEGSDVKGNNGSWPFGDRSKSNIDFQGSLRVRGGFAFDRSLLYVTGGLALGNINSDFYDGANHDSFSSLKAGWTVGAGMEYAFTDSWSASLEYRYTEFGRLKGETVTTDSGWYEIDKLRENAIRVGVSYHF